MERIYERIDTETVCARAGIGQGDAEPLVVPIAQSTTYCRDGMESTAEHQYSRVSNPTVAALESALGDLEGTPPAVCFGSGLAAESALFLAVLRAGDHWVCGRGVYGGTTRLGQQLLDGLGIDVTFVDATDVDAIRHALRPNTRLVFIETPANPTLEITDIAAVARVTREAGALLAVDNTFLTPVLQQPLAFGADISVYSTTKFVDGHSVALGGALVCRDAALLERLRFVRKSTGGIQTPFNAWLTLLGLKTLPLRLRHQSRTAARIADWLARQPEIACVNYPRTRDAAAVQHAGTHGAVLSFELAGGFAAASRFVDALRLCRLVEHVGSVETLVTHPASMTHGDVPREERLESGIADGLLRLSVGLESSEALLEDLERGLRASAQVKEASCA